jgi:hypothetical protein
MSRLEGHRNGRDGGIGGRRRERADSGRLSVYDGGFRRGGLDLKRDSPKLILFFSFWVLCVVGCGYAVKGVTIGRL